MSSRFIRLENPKTKLSGSYVYISAVDLEIYDADGSSNSTYTYITITGVGTDFTGELSDGDVIQLCSDSTMFNTYDSFNVSLSDRKYKYSMQFETVLEEYEVVSRDSTTSMVVKPYTITDEETQSALNRVSKIYTRAYTNDSGDYESLRFSTIYIKPLTNFKTSDEIVNIDQISHFHINSSNAQNMDVHFADTGNGATRTLTVHNCFDYLNYILQPFTQLEQQRIFYEYSETDLTVAQPTFYSNYSYPYKEEYRKEREAKSKEEKEILQRSKFRNRKSEKQ